MRVRLGEEGTEQFEVITHVDRREVMRQKIHDPFAHTTVMVGLTRLDHFCAIFRKRQIRVEVSIQGSQGAQQAIMTLDPTALAIATDEHLEAMRISRESSPTIGYYVDAEAT